MPLTFPVHLPRHAFSVRDAPRAADLWRCFQEAAVTGSTQCGWPPSRYREEGSAFVVRSMTVVHRAEPQYGEALSAKTWVANFRRGILSRREIRISSGGQAVAAASQEWVHVSEGLKPVRASEACLDAFVVEEIEEPQRMPTVRNAEEVATFQFTFEAWHTWMDPLGHANHPMYLDWCDESVSRWMYRAGLAPIRLKPIAETITWKLGVEAPQAVTVDTALMGQTECGEAVFEHTIRNDTGVLCASAVTVRTLLDAPDGTLFQVLQANQ